MDASLTKSLKSAVDQAPTSPGCYLWKDDGDVTLYVGKAINLRARLRNYLATGLENLRTRLLMERARKLEWISTATDSEALILEANLVKKLQPRFNVRLKDDKRYPYICVSTSEPFPQIFITRQVKDDGNRYFGPFTDVRATRNTLALIHKIFPIRKVRQVLPARRPKKPCMNFHIKRCLGPCQGNVPVEEYAGVVREILLFLEGRREVLEDVVRKRMNEYSESLEYEKASIYRDMLSNIRRATEDQNVVQPNANDEDVIAVATRDDHGQIALLEVRGGRLLDRKSFPLVGVTGASPTEIVESFLRDYYLESQAVPPARILLPARPDGRTRKLLEPLLGERAGRRVRLLAGMHREKRGLVRIASRNAELLLTERLLATRHRDRERAMADLREMLGLSDLPTVIECYDISHTSGTETVASGVMFVDGAPQPSAYRRYRIRATDGIDDPASMREVVARRLQRLLNESKALPDLMLIDGGPTQLTAACEAAAALGAGALPIVSIAKKNEEIYLPGVREPLQPDSNRPAMRLLRQLRDEAHRFAITYHRQLRNKAALRHLLDDVNDIGPQRKKALLKHFADREIQAADLNELRAVPGIGPELAGKIRAYFDSQETRSAAAGTENSR
ncbi:MAG: excinuclease ABC subunit UvrC [Spirochaetales bacterium]|nr:excinuclease ABC subunit UvrC [Leptospiraceae bacterium]MCP5483306.1 excinuclease ABC subunit UvrC [Spirochaetales bacterium]